MLPYDEIKKDALFVNRTLQAIGYEYDDEKIRAAFNELAPQTDIEAAEKVMSYRVLPREIREDLTNGRLKAQDFDKGVTASQNGEERFTGFDEVLGVAEAGKHADSKSHSAQKPEQDKGSKLGSLDDGPG